MENFMKLRNALLAIVVTGAAAQSPNPYDGTWKATWRGASRIEEATVIIKGTGGSWQRRYARQWDNPCIGRKAPIKIIAATPDELKFAAMFSEVITGCGTFNVYLKPDGPVLKGVGWAIEMTRED